MTHQSFTSLAWIWHQGEPFFPSYGCLLCSQQITVNFDRVLEARKPPYWTSCFQNDSADSVIDWINKMLLPCYIKILQHKGTWPGCTLSIKILPTSAPASPAGPCLPLKFQNCLWGVGPCCPDPLGLWGLRLAVWYLKSGYDVYVHKPKNMSVRRKETWQNMMRLSVN